MESNTLKLVNSSGIGKLLIVEPWAHEFEMKIGSTLDLNVISPNKIQYVLEDAGKYLIVWIESTGSTFELKQDKLVLGGSDVCSP
jgi:hypothetical protein